MFSMSKRHLKRFSLILALVFVFSGTVAYAATFKDVSSTHWAKEYIDKVSKAGLILGDNEGNFRPKANVTKLEAAIMLARMMGMDATKTAKAKQEYQAFLTQNNIPTWAQDGVAVALAAKVVTQDEVKGFYVNGQPAVAQKVDITRYLTKAMGLEEEAKKTTIVRLSFKDAESIGSEDTRYVDMMIKKGIIDPNGDEQGKFNPSSLVTRDVMAKMLSVGYDYMVANLLLNRPFPGDTVAVKTQTITGTISSILRTNSEVYITIEDRIGQRSTYVVNSNSDVKLDNNKILYTELIEGLKFEAKVTEDYKVVSLYAEGINEEYKGIVKSVIQTSPQMLTIEYTTNESTKTTARKSFSIDSNVDITLDGKSAFLREIKEGDNAEIKVINSKITRIKAESRYLKLTGTIKDIKLASSDYYLVIEDKDEKTFEYPMDKYVSVYRNKSKAKVIDLRKGDNVTIDIEYGVITDIEAKIVKKEGEGSVVSILHAKKPEITIINNKGEKETYFIGLGATIRLDKERAELYDIREGYFIEYTAEGDEITSLYALTRQRNNIYIGNIKAITTRHSMITVMLYDVYNNTSEEKTIFYTSDTTFMNLYGSTVRESSLDVGDEIIIIANYNDTFIEAISIIVPYKK